LDPRRGWAIRYLHFTVLITLFGNPMLMKATIFSLLISSRLTTLLSLACLLAACNHSTQLKKDPQDASAPIPAKRSIDQRVSRAQPRTPSEQGIAGPSMPIDAQLKSRRGCSIGHTFRASTPPPSLHAHPRLAGARCQRYNFSPN